MKYKLLFHISALLLIATEAYRTYLLSPIPGSQEVSAVEASYFLWHYRWYIRIALFIGMIIGFRKVFEKRRWIPIMTILLTATVFYLANFEMAAEYMFKPATEVLYADVSEAKVPADAIVIAVTNGNESHAYPVRYLSYHHQLTDNVGGKEVLVTYCDVCRSGLVFDPKLLPGDHSFRLVGMDQFNAMLEDHQTGSWWMQANGECVAGEHKGQKLDIFPSEQLTLAEWSKRYPEGKVMAPIPEYEQFYGDDSFEKGTTTNSLTRTDTASWQDKSWVIGVEVNGHHRAYDWSTLVRQRAIYDIIDHQEIGITIDSANINYTILKRVPCPNMDYTSDSLSLSADGVCYQPDPAIMARQMFWHTWRTFYPNTTRYGVK